MLIPYRYLRGPFLPAKLVKIGAAARSFKGHMMDMLEEETNALRENRSGSGGRMGSFVHALDVHAREAVTLPESEATKNSKRGLFIDEIFGNIFILNFAGYDTTANTMGFALYLWAIYPELQDWVAEELTAVVGSSEVAIEAWDYHVLFPRLKRCRAILLETLRLYTPIVAIPKWTATRSQTLNIGITYDDEAKTVTIPPGVYASPHLSAIHTHPTCWHEAGRWKPLSWIVNSSVSSAGQDLAKEELYEPAANTYFPWSDGPMIRKTVWAKNSYRSKQSQYWRACSRLIACRC